MKGRRKVKSRRRWLYASDGGITSGARQEECRQIERSRLRPVIRRIRVE